MSSSDASDLVDSDEAESQPIKRFLRQKGSTVPSASTAGAKGGGRGGAAAMSSSDASDLVDSDETVPQTKKRSLYRRNSLASAASKGGVKKRMRVECSGGGGAAARDGPRIANKGECNGKDVPLSDVVTTQSRYFPVIAGRCS